MEKAEIIDRASKYTEKVTMLCVTYKIRIDTHTMYGVFEMIGKNGQLFVVVPGSRSMFRPEEIEEMREIFPMAVVGSLNEQLEITDRVANMKTRLP